MWGGAALILSAIPNLNLLGVVPLLILLFMRRQQDGVDAGPLRSVCSKCSAPHTPDQHFCINCGWELAKPYLDEISAGEEQVSTQSGAQYTEPRVATSDSAPGDSAVPDSPLREAELVAEAGSTSQGEAAAPEPALEDVPAEVHAESSEEAPAEPEVRRYRGIPTAPGMTQWGIDLFNLGRIQESIDQFTKAIALDPNFKMAWQRRAESYAKLGRGEEAAEDRRRLRALNATASPG